MKCARARDKGRHIEKQRHVSSGVHPRPKGVFRYTNGAAAFVECPRCECQRLRLVWSSADRTRIACLGCGHEFTRRVRYTTVDEGKVRGLHDITLASNPWPKHDYV